MFGSVVVTVGLLASQVSTPALANPSFDILHVDTVDWLDGGRPRRAVRSATGDVARVWELDADRRYDVHIGSGAVASLVENELDILVEAGFSVRTLMPRLSLFLVEREDLDSLDVVATLGATPAIRPTTLVPDLVYSHTRYDLDPSFPDDERYGGQWYLDTISIREAWQHSLGDESVDVVIVDNGCDLQQPDLVDKMLPGIDVVDEDDDASYEPDHLGNEHGTACAGLVAASTDNEIGVAGVCPECRLRCVRLLSDDGVPLSADIAAFDFALEQNSAIVSNSWGFSVAMAVPTPLRDAIEIVMSEGRGGLGALVVFAVGNDNRYINNDELQAIPGVLGVGAITQWDELTSFSNYGDAVDMVAPVGTLTTDITGADGAESGDYNSNFGGTSSACPLVAGVGALLASAAPALTGDEIHDLLIETVRPAPYAVVDDRGHSDDYGWGIVDPGAAVRRSLGVIDEEDGQDSENDGDDDAGTTDADAGATGEDDLPEDDDELPGLGCHSIPNATTILAWFALTGLLRRQRTRHG